MSLTGRQTTTWTYDHVGSGSCDADRHGSGSETFTFSARPTVMHTYDGLSQPTFFNRKGNGELVLKLRGSAARTGGITTGAPPDPGECADGDGTTAVTPPDCGTRAVSFKVKPAYQFKKDWIVLEQQTSPKAFKNCVTMGQGAPWLLQRDSDGKDVGRDLPYDDLFAYGKNILIATGTEKGDDGEARWTTKVRWTLTFKRLKVEALTRKH